MRRFILIITIIFCVSGFAFSQTAAQVAQETIEEFFPRDAYFLGRAVAANILTTYKIYNNQEATEYLNKICKTLVINSTHPSTYSGYFVVILDSAEFNAFATPGGHIFLTKGLIDLISSEDMLAAVIAHELAHVMLRHGINIITENKVENELSDLADWASSVAARHSTQAKQVFNFRDSISRNVDVIMRSGYSQAQELEADLEAIILLARAGYDPKALIEMLHVLNAVQPAQRNGFFSTHPSPQQRIENIQSLQIRENVTKSSRERRFKEMKF